MNHSTLQNQRHRERAVLAAEFPPLPKRRVRDVVGPFRRPRRVDRCVNVTNSLMARPNGSSAPASARQYGFPLLLLLRLFCNQSCGHQQVDMLSLSLGRSRPGRVLVKVFSASLVRIVRDDTSRLVAAPRQMNCKHGRIIGQAAMVRRSRTSWTCSWDGHSGTLQRHWHWVDCRRAAIVRFWVADRSDSWSVLAFGAKWIISGRRPVRCGGRLDSAG